MPEQEKIVEVVLTTAEGKKIVKKKANINNIFKLGSERDKILDSHSWLDQQITKQILMHFFEEWNQKYFDMEEILKGMAFSKKLQILKDLKLVHSDIYNDLNTISLCRNKFVHPPIVETIDELLWSDDIQTREIKTIPKKLSEIKSSEEFMETYQKVCKGINEIFEERESKWLQNISKKMYDALPDEFKRKLPFVFA